MIPRIDPSVRHVGVSYLRKLNASQLRQLDGAIVICDNSEPLAVIVSYETFLRIQRDVEFPPLSINDAVRREREQRGKGDKTR